MKTPFHFQNFQTRTNIKEEHLLSDGGLQRNFLSLSTIKETSKVLAPFTSSNLTKREIFDSEKTHFTLHYAKLWKYIAKVASFKSRTCHCPVTSARYYLATRNLVIKAACASRHDDSEGWKSQQWEAVSAYLSADGGRPLRGLLTCAYRASKGKAWSRGLCGRSEPGLWLRSILLSRDESREPIPA